MNLDLHVWRFDWAGPPARIGPGVAALAELGAIEAKRRRRGGLCSTRRDENGGCVLQPSPQRGDE